MADVNLTVGARDDGAIALLRQILKQLQSQNQAVVQSARVQKQARDAKGRFIKATQASAAALRGETAAVKQTAAAQIQANREVARALQQRTQAELVALRAETQRSRAGLANSRREASERERAHQREQATFRASQQLAREQNRTRSEATRAELAAIRVQQQRAVEQARADRLSARSAMEAARARQRAADIEINAAKSASVQARIAAGDRRIAAQQALQQGRVQMQAANNAARAARQQTSIQNQQANAARRAEQAQRRLQMQSARTTASLGANTSALRSYVGQVVRYAALYGGIRLFSGFIRQGLRFNEILESARLGIASIITATSNVFEPVSDRLVVGAEALEVAMAGAENQVNKLRIAGLQTAATTEELVQAYQSAVAAGIGAGLNLDEIRKVTVQIVQAAGSIGLPMQQLEQEVRSILDATIDRNSRVARVLGISNEEVRLAKEQNRLAEMLNEKLQSFTVAGEEALKTWRVMRSNMEEALEVFAGEATRPLFEELGRTGQEALAKMFDFDQARISDAFQGLVKGSQEFFQTVAQFLSRGIERAVRGLEDMGEWLRDNRVQVAVTIDAFIVMAGAVGQVVADLAKAVGWLIRAGVESGTLAAAMDVVRQTAEALSGVPIITIVTLAALSKAVSLFFALGTALKGIKAAMAGGMVAGLTLPWIAAAAAVSILAGGLALLIARNGEARREAARMGEVLVQQAKDTGSAAVNLAELGTQYERLQEKLDGLEAGTNDYASVQGQMNLLYERILQLSPEVALAMQAEKEGRQDVADAVWDQVAAQRALLVQQQIDAALRYNEAKAIEDEFIRRADLLEEGGGFSVVTKKTLEMNSEFMAVEETVRKTGEELNEVIAQMGEIDEALRLRNLGRFEALAGDPDNPLGGGSGSDNNLKQRIEAQIAMLRDALDSLKKDLKLSLDANSITYTTYFSQLSAAEAEFARTAVGLYRGLQPLLKDQGDRDSIEGKIVDINTKAVAQVKQNNAEMKQSYVDLFEEIEGLDIELLQEQGETAEALQRQLTAQYRDLLDRLRAEGLNMQADTLNDLIDLKRTRILLDEVGELVSQATSKMQGELGQIEAQVITGVTKEWDARDQVVGVYRRHAQVLMELRRVQLRTAIEGTEGSEMARLAVEELDQQIVQAMISFREAERAANELLTRSEDAFQSDLASWMAEGIDNALSLADAFRMLAESVVNSIRRIVSEMLATRITEQLFGLIEGSSALSGGGKGALVAAGAKAAGMAEGGYVSGRGSSTSDSIPALLSNGEYVLRAGAVRNIGMDALNEINFGSRTPPIRRRGGGHRFAEGGPVMVGGGRGGFTATLGLAPGLVVESLQTRDGTRAMVNFLGGNRRAIRAALGL